MAEAYSREHEDQRAKSRESEREEQPEHDQAQPGLGMMALYAGGLLGNRRLQASRNTSLRASAMLGVQRSVGNRAVQRMTQLQRSAASSADVDDEDIAGRIEAMAGKGQGLETMAKTKLERELGVDLSGVHVHIDKEADELAKAVDSIAFTSGHDIFFRAGMYNPNTDEGLRLLAHETTHTIQQSEGPVDGTPSAGGVALSHPDDKFEQAAEKTADAVVAQTKRESSGRGSSETPAQRYMGLEPEELPAVQDVASAVGGGISDMGSFFGRGISGGASLIGSADATLGQTLGRGTSGISSMLGGALSTAGDATGLSTLSALGGGISSVGGALGGGISSLGGAIGHDISGIGGSIGGAVSEGAEGLGGLVSGLPKFLEENPGSLLM